MTQNPNILAGLRALVEQIDLIEKQNAARSAMPPQPGNHATQPDSSGHEFIAIGESRLWPAAAPARAARPMSSSSSATNGRAATIAKRLGVSSRNFHTVAHAMGRDVFAN